MTKMPEPAFIPYEGCRPYYTADQLKQYGGDDVAAVIRAMKEQIK
jgi:hypothetical protein